MNFAAGTVPADLCGMAYRDVGALLEHIERLEAAHVVRRARANRRARRRHRRLVVSTLLFVPFVLGCLAFFLSIRSACGCTSQKEQARNDMRALHPAAEKWVADHPQNPCPSFEELVIAKEISAASRNVDPWQHPYLIRCGGHEEVRIESAGPDGQFGTYDDVVVPRSESP